MLCADDHEAHSFKELAAMCVAEATAALEDAARAVQRDEFATLLERIDADLRKSRELQARMFRDLFLAS